MSGEDRIRILCEHCGVGIRAKSKYIGRMVACPSCQQQIVVQEPDEEEVICEIVEPETPKNTFKPSLGLDPESARKPTTELRSAPDAIGQFVSTKFCHHCGNSIAKAAEICPKCGVRQASTAKNDGRKLTAALLAFFLGIIGAHWFYLGNTSKGMIYLSCSIFGAPFFLIPTLVISILSVVDCIRILGLSSEDFDICYPPR